MKKIIIIITAISLLFVGCSSSGENDSKVIFNSYDEAFSIETVSSWQNVTKGELNELANLEIANYDENKYFMALMESKEDFDLSYDEYKDYMISDIEDRYKIQIEEKKDIKIGDYDCIYVEFKSSEEGSSVNFYMQVYIIETKNYYGRLFAWTTYSQRDTYKDEFIKMAQTFVEK